jgi:hypothetical protein
MFIERVVKYILFAWFACCVALTGFCGAQIPNSAPPVGATEQARAAEQDTQTSENVQKSRLALAKSGDPRQLQQFVCEMYVADKHTMQSMALDDVSAIGGWFAIQFIANCSRPRRASDT